MKETLELLRRAKARLKEALEHGDRQAAAEARQGIRALEWLRARKENRPRRREDDRDE